MPPGAAHESRGAFHPFGKHDRRTSSALLLQRCRQWQIPLCIRRCPIGQHALLRKSGDVSGKLLCRGQRFAGADHAIGKPHVERLVSWHGTAGQDQLLLGSFNNTVTVTGIEHLTGGSLSDDITVNFIDIAGGNYDGAGGTDTLQLTGGGFLTAGSLANVINWEFWNLGSNQSYALTLNDANVGVGQTLTINGAAVTNAVESLHIDASGEIDGNLDITGGAGQDRLIGGQNNDIISGGAGNDEITGGGGADILTGGAGQNVFVFNGAADSNDPNTDGITDFDPFNDLIEFNGISGVDLNPIDHGTKANITAGITDANASADAQLHFFNDGTHGYLYIQDTVPVGQDFNGFLLRLDNTLAAPGLGNFSTGSFDQFISGTASADILVGGRGNDDIEGFAGDDVIYGGLGSDAISGGAGQDTLSGGAGTDYFIYDTEAHSDVGIGNRDRIIDANFDNGSAERDFIVLENLVADGDDFEFESNGILDGITGLVQSILVGNILTLDFNSDQVLNIGVDMEIDISGYTGTLDASDFKIVTIGTAGQDSFSGGTHDNYFRATTTASTAVTIATAAIAAEQDTLTLAGGADGIDTLVFGDDLELLSAVFDDITDDLTFFYLDPVTGYIHKTVVVDHGAGKSIDYVEFEFDDDTPEADIFAVATAFDSSAATENTMIAGTTGADILIGGTGNDLLLGNAGADTLIGGDGDDTFIGGDGVDNFQGGNGIDTVSFFDSGVGVVIDLSGGTTNNDGYGNADTFTDIEGIEGSDYNDHLIGNSLSNFLSGGDGDDFIEGGGGADILEGGEGGDVFIYSTPGDSGIGNALRDVIKDFNASGVDQIDISGLQIGTFSFIGDESIAFSNTGNTEARFNSETKILEIDADGDAQADMEIELQNVDGANLDETDFLSANTPA